MKIEQIKKGINKAFIAKLEKYAQDNDLLLLDIIRNPIALKKMLNKVTS